MRFRPSDESQPEVIAGSVVRQMRVGPFLNSSFRSRWIVLAPVLLLHHVALSSDQIADASVGEAVSGINAVVLLFMFVVFSPVDPM